MGFGPNVDFPFDKKHLIEAQKSDVNQTSYFSAAEDKLVLPNCAVAYFLDDGVLMRKWSPEKKQDWSSVFQVVVPKDYREYILHVAHDHELSGHLGVKKTNCYRLKHFFWPGMKASVTQYC